MTELVINWEESMDQIYRHQNVRTLCVLLSDSPGMCSPEGDRLSFGASGWATEYGAVRGKPVISPTIKRQNGFGKRCSETSGTALSVRKTLKEAGSFCVVMSWIWFLKAGSKLRPWRMGGEH